MKRSFYPHTYLNPPCPYKWPHIVSCTKTRSQLPLNYHFHHSARKWTHIGNYYLVNGTLALLLLLLSIASLEKSEMTLAYLSFFGWWYFINQFSEAFVIRKYRTRERVWEESRVGDENLLRHLPVASTGCERVCTFTNWLNLLLLLFSSVVARSRGGHVV